MSATLRTAAGVPVAHKPIVFTAGRTTLCTAITGTDGVATCTLPLHQEVAVLANHGYTETFAGDSDYLASQSMTRFVQ